MHFKLPPKQHVHNLVHVHINHAVFSFENPVEKMRFAVLPFWCHCDLIAKTSRNIKQSLAKITTFHCVMHHMRLDTFVLHTFLFQSRSFHYLYCSSIFLTWMYVHWCASWASGKHPVPNLDNRKLCLESTERHQIPYKGVIAMSPWSNGIAALSMVWLLSPICSPGSMACTSPARWFVTCGSFSGISGGRAPLTILVTTEAQLYSLVACGFTALPLPTTFSLTWSKQHGIYALPSGRHFVTSLYIVKWNHWWKITIEICENVLFKGGLVTMRGWFACEKKCSSRTGNKEGYACEKVLLKEGL